MGSPTILQERPFRSVHLEDHDGRPVVAKRFHHPGRLRGLFDGARARGEFRILEELHRRGLPVPRPLAVRRVPGGFELTMEPIQNARSLQERLEEDGPSSVAPLLPGLGRMLARFQDAGLRHLDLHPGNLLFDDAGRPYLIDFHRARLEPASIPRERRLRDLVVLGAATRERLGPGDRARFLGAWARETRTGSLRALGRSLERAARRRRRGEVQRGLDRWLRASSRCELDPDGVLRARRAPLGEGAPLEGSEPERRRAWLAAARLLEHRLPCLGPLSHGPRGTRLEAADGDGPAEGLFDPADPRGDDLAEEFGHLLGALHDRGLDLSPVAARRALESRGGTLVLGPTNELGTVDTPGDAVASRRAFEEALPPSRVEALGRGYGRSPARYFS